MKTTKIIKMLIIINLILIGIIYIFISKVNVNNKKQIIKEMTETEYEESITSLNKSQEEYAKNVEEGKKKIDIAIIDMGVTTSDRETLETMSNNIRNITGESSADKVSYDNTNSGLTATNVQGAVDELNDSLGGLRFGTDGDGNFGYYGADDSLIPFKSAPKIIATVPKFLYIGNVDDNVYRTPTWVIDENICSISDGTITYNGNGATVYVKAILNGVGARCNISINSDDGETYSGGTRHLTYNLNKGDTILVRARSNHTSHTCIVMACIIEND